MKKPKWRGLRIFATYWWAERRRLLFVNFLLLLKSVIALAIPWLLGELLKAAGAAAAERIDQLAGQLLFLLALGALISFGENRYGLVLRQLITARIRQEVLGHIVKLPLNTINGAQSGDLLSLLNSDVGAVQEGLNGAFSQVCRQLVVLVGGFILLWGISPKLTLLMLFIFPLVGLIAKLLGRRARDLTATFQNDLGQLSGLTAEIFNNMLLVKSCGLEDYFSRKYAAANDNLLTTVAAQGKNRGFFEAFITVALRGSLVFLLWYGARILAPEGQLAAGDLVKFGLYSLYISGSVSGVASFYSNLQRALGAGSRLADILSWPLEAQSGPVPAADKGLKIESLSFHYPSRPDSQVLKNFSLTLHPGEIVALVGPSGSGKSTLAALIMGFYMPDSGRILADDVEIRADNVVAWRRAVSLVSQDSQIFSGTLAENIRLGRLTATTADIEAVCAAVGLADFIATLPEGLNTPLGEHGVTLSGGQKQRVALARALLSNPRLLILDEPTASLDRESEAALFSVLKAAAAGRTTLVITHHPDAVLGASRIIDLKEV